MRIARIVSYQSRAIVVIVALLCAAGLYAAWQLPVAVFPQTDFPRIVIIVDNGEAPAAQTLVSVTRPIEEAMNGIPGIARIRSKTARGSAEINLYFDWNGNILQELQFVQARMSQLVATLPPNAEIRNIERLTFAVFPVVGYSLTSDKRDEATLRDLATYVVRPQLARLPGVAIVGVAGGKAKEFHVQIDPEKLVAHNVSAQQVVEGIRNSNIMVSPGLIEENHQLELALISGQAKRPDELNSIVVATVNSAPVMVSDVATVTAGVEPQYTMVTADGHRAALVNINRQPDANTVAVVDEVKSALTAMDQVRS
jgi:multidrug efflux pump subunit AcrB